VSTKLVKGTAVVSLADGAKLGTVDHVYLDPARKEIVGFSFHQGGGLFGSKASGLVDVSDVHAFGDDAVTVSDVSTIRSELALSAQRDELIELEDLLKRKVLTEGGVFVGQIVSVRFGHDSYRLTGIEVSPGFFKDNRVLPADSVRQIGSELVVVSDAVCAPPRERPVERHLVRVA
jgi:uncharacterized protein YrrD